MRWVTVSLVASIAFGAGAAVGIMLGYINYGPRRGDPYGQYYFAWMVNMCHAYYEGRDKDERVTDWQFPEEVRLHALVRAIIDNDVALVRAILKDSAIDLNAKLSFSGESLFAYLLICNYDKWDSDEILDILYRHGMDIPAQPFSARPFSDEYATTVAAMHGKIKILRWLLTHGAPMPTAKDIKEIQQCLEEGVPCDPKSGLGARPFDAELILNVMRCIRSRPITLAPTCEK